MLVSVIVPNHGRIITTLKKSVEDSTYKNVELLVIDRGYERSEQRNMGIYEAKGEAFLFLDSDQSIHPKLIEECVELIKLGYGSVYIPEIIVAKSFFGKVRAYERNFYTGTAVDVPRFVKKCICPKFDTLLRGPEDSDWGNRIIGLKVVSSYPVYHHDDIAFLEYFRKKAYYAKSMKRYVEKNPYDKILDWRWRCFGVFFEKGKWKKVLRHPILFACVMGIILIRGFIYLWSKIR